MIGLVSFWKVKVFINPWTALCSNLIKMLGFLQPRFIKTVHYIISAYCIHCTLHTLLLDSIMLLAMIFPWTNSFPDRYFIPRATC